MAITQIDPNNKPHLIMMVGISNSGKSTYAKKMFPSAPIVNTDAICMALFGDINFDLSRRATISMVATAMVRALFHAGHQFVVLDACNLTQAKRNYWKVPHHWHRAIHFMPTDVVQAQSRLKKSYIQRGEAIDAYGKDLMQAIVGMGEAIQAVGQDELAEGETLTLVSALPDYL
jgi:predicted kinase